MTTTEQTQTAQEQGDYSREQVYKQQVADASRSSRQSERDQLDSKVIQGSIGVVAEFTQSTAVLGLSEKDQTHIKSVAVAAKLTATTFTVVKDALKRLFKTEADFQLPSFKNDPKVESVNPGIKAAGTDADAQNDAEVRPEIKGTGTEGPGGP